MRTHGRLEVAQAITTVAPGCQFGFIVEDGAHWTGTPLDSVELPWLYINNLSPGTTPASILAGGPPATTYLFGTDVDIRARRRVPELNDTYLFCISNPSATALTYSLFVRTLVMLH